MNKVIYRVSVCGSKDFCTEFWESLPLSNWFTSKADANNALESARQMTTEQIEDKVNACIGSNRPELEEDEIDIAGMSGVTDKTAIGITTFLSDYEKCVRENTCGNCHNRLTQDDAVDLLAKAVGLLREVVAA